MMYAKRIKNNMDKGGYFVRVPVRMDCRAVYDVSDGIPPLGQLRCSIGDATQLLPSRHDLCAPKGSGSVAQKVFAETQGRVFPPGVVACNARDVCHRVYDARPLLRTFTDGRDVHLGPYPILLVCALENPAHVFINA
ncbi:MAG: hypothetical protein UY52_C0002G0018 [Parcubacteria group bacterium GW2011_GWC2_49_9]|nr:MAG: hypothetical protein UY34_C0001G0088 [Parcubacteria group bacterium GW2011_GWA2_48_9]KKW16604.1 MAG: hypothetical protein UY52_C0002G0018 [Parcubacteria group bacterium GW2011_GWC2_49_9]